MKFINLKYKDYVVLDKETKQLYNYAFRNSEDITQGKDVFNIGSLRMQTFSTVRNIQAFFHDQESTIELFIKYALVMQEFTKTEKHLSTNDFGIDDIYELRIFDIMLQYYYVLNEVVSINKDERDFLSSEPDEKEINAGISRFSTYSEFIQYDTIATAYSITPVEAMKFRYAIAFAKLRYEKDKSDFNKLYMKQNKPKPQKNNNKWA
jgi:hypothetical protein